MTSNPQPAITNNVATNPPDSECLNKLKIGKELLEMNLEFHKHAKKHGLDKLTIEEIQEIIHLKSMPTKSFSKPSKGQ